MSPVTSKDIGHLKSAEEVFGSPFISVSSSTYRVFHIIQVLFPPPNVIATEPNYFSIYK